MNDLVESNVGLKGCVETSSEALDEQNILSNLRLIYPKSEIYTGRIESSFLYQREFKKGGDHSRDEDYSYWWITIKTLSGDEVSYNIEAEDKNVNALKKGDLVSIIKTKDAYLKHPFKNKKDQKIVVSDEFATAIVFHRGEDSGQVIDSFVKPSRKKELSELAGPAFFYVFVFALADFLIFKGKVHELLLGWFSSRADDMLMAMLLFWLSAISLITYVKKKIFDNKYKKESTLFKAIEQASEQLLIFHYHRKLESEVESMVSPDGSSISDVISVSSMKARYPELFEEWKNTFEYRHVLAPNEKGSASSTAQLVRVVNKDIDVSVTGGTRGYTQRTTTTYRETRYGMVTRQEHRDRDFSHTTRNSDINGKVKVELASGEVEEIKIPYDALRSVDVGDWLFVGKTDLDMGDFTHHFTELTYNLNKDIKDSGYSISSYGEISNLSIFLIVLASAVCIYLDQTNFRKDIIEQVLVPFLGFVLIFSVVNIFRNKLSKKRLQGKFNKRLSYCLEKRDEILKIIA